MSALGQTHFRQQLFCLLLGSVFLRPTNAQRAKHDVFQRGQMREKIELLEHHPGFLTDQTLVDLRVVDLEPINDQIAGGNLFEFIYAAQQRGFTGTRWPDNHHHFALLNAQIDVMQHLGRAKML